MIKNYSSRLIEWYCLNARDLPWRHTNDPYRIWLSEVMLQQTRANAVIPYYNRFVCEVPDIRSLAAISDDSLMKLWEGLGYYSRARNLKKCAQIIVNKYNGSLPSEPDTLRSLPGFGPYTSAAVGAFAFGLPEIPIDGNVFRVFCRFYGICDDLRKDSTKDKIRIIAKENVVSSAADFGQALIELGATVCIPGVPLCDICPLQEGCTAYNSGRCAELPYMSPKKVRKTEKLTVIIIKSGNRLVLHKRPDSGLLAGLYEFPSLKGDAFSEEMMLSFVRSIGFDPLHIRKLTSAKHIFTHIEWIMNAFWVDTAEDNCCNHSDYFLADNVDIQKKYPIPSAFSPWMSEIQSLLIDSSHS